MRHDTDREDQRAADPANWSHWIAPLAFCACGHVEAAHGKSITAVVCDVAGCRCGKYEPEDVTT